MKLRWKILRDLEFAPRYNIAPSPRVPVLVKGESGYDAPLRKWGLVTRCLVVALCPVKSDGSNRGDFVTKPARR